MSNKEHDASERFRPGDVFEGYYFPGVLCGRTLCYYRDVVRLLKVYGRRVRSPDWGLDFKTPGTFELFSRTYREMKFSAVQFCTEVEEREECFYILLGVVVRLFDKKIELDSLSGQDPRQLRDCLSKQDDLWRKHGDSKSQETGDGGEGALDLNVSMIIMDSLHDSFGAGEGHDLEVGGLEELHHNVTVIYLLFLIFKSQYRAGLEDGQEESRLFEYMRIPVTIETLETIKRVVQECEANGNVFPETRFIVSSMLQEGVLLVNLYNGPQYYYQDRYGNPLVPDPLEKRFLDVQGMADSATSLCEEGEARQTDEQAFTDYLQDLKDQMARMIEEKRLEQHEGQLKEEDQTMLETLQKLLSDFERRLAEYEQFKLRHSQRLDGVDLKVPKELSSGEEDAKRRRVEDHEETSLSTVPSKQRECGNWKELLGERSSVSEEPSRTKPPRIGTEQNCNQKAVIYHDTPPVTLSSNTEKSHDLDESDNSLVSILNRIEELVNREI